MRDNKGQLLLLAVVFLAITLIVLASAATVFLNVKQNQMNGSLADEYDNIKEKFGFAMNEKANIYNESGMSKPDAINRSFNETKNDFEILLSYKGFDFDAECIVDDNNVSVNISITSSSQILSESVNYTIVWEEAGPGPAGIRIYPDGSADETIVKGVSAGGNYANTQYDDDITRNITEVDVTDDISVHPDESVDEVITEGVSAGGDYLNTTADDDITRNITENATDLINVTNGVDENVTTYGTIENFTYAQTEDGNYATLTEKDTGGGGVGGDAYANSKDTVNTGFYGADNAGDVVTDLQTADWASGSDTGLYLLAKNGIMYINGFDTTGMSGTVTSAVLHLRYSTMNGITCTNDIRWALTDGDTWTTTGIAPSDMTTSADYDGVSADQTYTFSPTPTLAQIGSMCINYMNNDGAGPDTIGFDYMYITVTVTGSNNYELNITFNTTLVVSAANYYLEINYSANGEEYDVLVYNATSTEWDDVGDLTASGMTQKNFTLASDHYDSGTIRVRYVGKIETGDTSESTLYIEYHRIRSYTPDYSLNVSYVLDDANIGDYSSYVLVVRANYSGASGEEFNITYQIDGAGAWYVLGYINSVTEQAFPTTLPTKPSINVTVRIVDNTTGATPSNTIRIDFIELHGSTVGYRLNVSYTLDDSLSGYSVYNLTVKANTSGLSTEKFNVTYQINGVGAWYVLGTIDSTTLQYLNFTLSESPTTKVVVRFVDDNPGTSPVANTLQIDFIELYCTN